MGAPIDTGHWVSKPASRVRKSPDLSVAIFFDQLSASGFDDGFSRVRSSSVWPFAQMQPRVASIDRRVDASRGDDGSVRCDGREPRDHDLLARRDGIARSCHAMSDGGLYAVPGRSSGVACPAIRLVVNSVMARPGIVSPHRRADGGEGDLGGVHLGGVQPAETLDAIQRGDWGD